MSDRPRDQRQWSVSRTTATIIAVAVVITVVLVLIIESGPHR